MNRLEVEDDSLFISNSEVLRILEKHQSEPGAGGCLKRDASLQDLHTVEKEVLIHLRKSRRCLSKEEIKSCMALFDEYKLPISEKLVLLNIQPSNIAELHPIIEDIDQRFSVEQQDKFINDFCSIVNPVSGDGSDNEEAQHDPA